MKKQFFLAFRYAFVAMFFLLFSGALRAQELAAHPITVQRANGQVDYYDDINKAFAKLTAHAIVYLPEGAYALSGHDSVRVKVPVAIYGAGSTITPNNKVRTQITGSGIVFAPGSEHSVLMGVYVLNHISIFVDNVLLKGVNADRILFKGVKGCTVNNSIIRGHVDGAPILLSNCLVGHIRSLSNSIIRNCILGSFSSSSYYDNTTFSSSLDLQLSNCIGRASKAGLFHKSQHTVDHCMLGRDGDITYPQDDVKGVFKKYDESAPFYDLLKQDYHLAKSIKGTDGTDIGLYGGDGFDPNGSPISRFTISKVADKTDKDGKLKVKIKIAAE